MGRRKSKGEGDPHSTRHSNQAPSFRSQGRSWLKCLLKNVTYQYIKDPTHKQMLQDAYHSNGDPTTAFSLPGASTDVPLKTDISHSGRMHLSTEPSPGPGFTMTDSHMRTLADAPCLDPAKNQQTPAWLEALEDLQDMGRWSPRGQMSSRLPQQGIC